MAFFQRLFPHLASYWGPIRSLARSRKPPPQSAPRWSLEAIDVAAYHRALVSETSGKGEIDDRTWSDLELEKLLHRLDRSITPLGTQYLYATLRGSLASMKQLTQNEEVIRTFQNEPARRLALESALTDLSRKESSDLAEFVLGPATSIPAYYRWFYLPALASLACTLGLFASSWFILPAIAVWILNLVLHACFARRVTRCSPALRSVSLLLAGTIKSARALEGLELATHLKLAKLSSTAASLRQKVSRGLTRLAEGNDLAVAVLEYLNLLCLFELCLTCEAISALNKHRADLTQLFQVMARLDALQGLALSLKELPYACVPQFKPGREFVLEDLYHPLVENPVPNTLRGSGQSLLLSGTNMSGKTTFMKALGINLVLAQTIGFCCARCAIIPRARIKTLIQRQEGVVTGQSYFLFEAAALLNMMKDAESENAECWFVIDEPFRGTNSLERIAAGQAVLSHLHGRWFVVASTHDRELSDLLGQEFDSCHFSEVLTAEDARFDYVLRPGPVQSRNAINLLIMAGYPKSITDGARRNCAELARDGNADFEKGRGAMT